MNATGRDAALHRRVPRAVPWHRPAAAAWPGGRIADASRPVRPTRIVGVVNWVDEQRGFHVVYFLSTARRSQNQGPSIQRSVGARRMVRSADQAFVHQAVDERRYVRRNARRTSSCLRTASPTPWTCLSGSACARCRSAAIRCCSAWFPRPNCEARHSRSQTATT